ncbi:Uncharacterised protein [Mycobacteroides abscessus subsp. abscessus]|nr:Uncharacterised protein [Mycobacteroides abscessus subsp. abscessus]
MVRAASSAVLIPHAANSPAIRSPNDSPRRVGPDSGEPVMLMIPDNACTTRS